MSLVPVGQAQVYEKVFSFTEARAADAGNKGSVPVSNLVQGIDGAYYGTTSAGGALNLGTVFKMTANGVRTTLLEFTGNAAINRGSGPAAGLIQGNDGNFYGTTSAGGASGYGTVFKMTSGGVLMTLVEFTGTTGAMRGSTPLGGLVLGSDGVLYGTASEGGAFNSGTVFKVTVTGAFTSLFDFRSGPMYLGYNPRTGLAQGSDGNFYGTTFWSGLNDGGTIFRITPAGSLSTVVDFASNGSGDRGSNPQGTLVLGRDGSFYGTTYFGGQQNSGTVFKTTQEGILTTLVHFTGTGTPNQGRFPKAGLIQGSNGDFYGTTSNKGEGYGTVFRMTPEGVLTTLAAFSSNGSSNKGAVPLASLVLGSNGSFYGTTSAGGASGKGTVFKMTPSGTLTTLVEFTGLAGAPRGSEPFQGVVEGDEGYLYGSTMFGGLASHGTIFKLSPGGVLSTLAELTGDNGVSTEMGSTSLLRTASGEFYGTSADGGLRNLGTIFKMTREGVLTTLIEFSGTANGNKGRSPSELTQGDDGNLYGTTAGSVEGTTELGTVFRMTPAGVFSTLVTFTGNGTSNKGRNPSGRLISSGGNFYGTTSAGGALGYGTIFKMTPAGVLTTLLEFTRDGATNKGCAPGSLTLGNDGNFYGVTQGLFDYNSGTSLDLCTVFKMTPTGVLTTLASLPANGEGVKGTILGALVYGPDGGLYGTTYQGGPLSRGTLFKITATGTVTTIKEFQTAEEGFPVVGMMLAKDGNLYGTSRGPDGSIYRLLFPGAPLAIVTKTESQGTTGVALEARVNARGSATGVTLEYGTDGVSFPQSTTVAFNLTGYQTNLVGSTLESLSSGATYYYRFRATSGAGTTLTPTRSFTTLALPIAASEAASQLAPTSVQLNGTVNARTFNTDVYFEWSSDGANFNKVVASVPDLVTGNSAVSVRGVVAGLTKGNTYFYRIVARNDGGVTVSSAQSFTTPTESVATLGSVTALSTTAARVTGSINARGSATQVTFEYGTDGLSFPNSFSATPASVSGSADTSVTTTLNNLSQGLTYYYRLRGTSVGGVGLGSVGSFKLDVLSGFTQVAPTAPSSAQGFVLVTLSPTGIGAGWRFVGEQTWRASGVPASGLTTGDREVEYKPVPGFLQPLRETVSVISGEEAVVLDRDYYDSQDGTVGGLNVVLKPDNLAASSVPVAQRAQWRLLGETDGQWRNSGVTIAGLVPGSYLVECKPLTGRTTPTILSVAVLEGQTAVATATYFLADAVVGTQPSVLTYEAVTGSPDLPYGFVGQFRGDAGSASGFVVKRRVVATAAHVVFDDGTLSYATGVQWLFQRHRGTYEPKPQSPRGYYVFDGYASQRTAEATPGQSSPRSQNLDAAAVYFLEDAGRGGYGGFLASDATDNEWLLSPTQKILAGYPVNGIAATNQGRMHATPAASVSFSRVPGTDAAGQPYRLYNTTDVTSVGGTSGGPLCVQLDGGKYYPAAIYLGGSAQTVVRAIDSGVIDLFNRAEISGDGGSNNTSGGIRQVNAPTGGGTFSPAGFQVKFAPAAAINAGARWSISPSPTLYTHNTEPQYRGGGKIILKFTKVAGFLDPPDAVVTLTAGVLSTITRTYFGVTSQPPDRTVAAFGDTTFSVVASGTPLRYQWRRNGVNLPGETSRVLSLSNVTAAQAGNYTCLVTWEETSGNVSQASAAGTLTVNPISQSVSFAALESKSVGDAPFQVSATANSGLPVVCRILSGPATISGSQVTLTGGLGAVTVRAEQAGDGNYKPAFLDRTFVVAGETLTTWRTHQFSAVEAADSNIAGSTADPDQDGLSNQLEFAFRLNPKLHDSGTVLAAGGSSGLPRISLEGPIGSPILTIEYLRRKAATAPGITYAAQFTSDLNNSNGWSTAATETATSLDATWERVQVADPNPSQKPRFGRVRVAAP